MAKAVITIEDFDDDEGSFGYRIEFEPELTEDQVEGIAELSEVYRAAAIAFRVLEITYPAVELEE